MAELIPLHKKTKGFDWEAISHSIPGKTKAQCKKKFIDSEGDSALNTLKQQLTATRQALKKRKINHQHLRTEQTPTTPFENTAFNEYAFQSTASTPQPSIQNLFPKQSIPSPFLSPPFAGNNTYMPTTPQFSSASLEPPLYPPLIVNILNILPLQTMLVSPASTGQQPIQAKTYTPPRAEVRPQPIPETSEKHTNHTQGIVTWHASPYEAKTNSVQYPPINWAAKHDTWTEKQITTLIEQISLHGDPITRKFDWEKICLELPGKTPQNCEDKWKRARKRTRLYSFKIQFLGIPETNRVVKRSKLAHKKDTIPYQEKVPLQLEIEPCPISPLQLEIEPCPISPFVDTTNIFENQEFPW